MNEPYAPDDWNAPPLTPQERNKRRPRETEAQLLEKSETINTTRDHST